MPDGPERTALTALVLTDFRNYAHLALDLSGRTAAFTGPNGAGKTNLLEAVSLLSPGRGLRRAAFPDMRRLGAADGWAVAATITRADVATQIGTGVTDERERARRVRVNGAPAASTEALMDHLRLVWLTPAMDGLFTGPASERRRFLDRLVLTRDPAHGRRVLDFERLTRSRNRLLEEGGDPRWLDAVEVELAGQAVAVAAARAATISLLTDSIAAQARDNSAFPVAALSLTDGFEPGLEALSEGEARDAFRTRLRAARGRDRAAGRTIEGPHRADLLVVLAEKGMAAALSSTGEQKALLIGLVLAQADLVARVSGATPVLLLDEVAAHLDGGRRAALFERIEALGLQALMTGTDAGLFSALGARGESFTVEHGAVRRIGD